MAEFPAMPLWTDAYLADTGHLTTLEHGAYVLLLMCAWRSGGRLPNDDKRLARFARLSSGQWARIRPTILEFFTIEGDQIVQGRLLEEMQAVRDRSKKASDSARSRYRKAKASDSRTLSRQTDKSEEFYSSGAKSLENNDTTHANAERSDSVRTASISISIEEEKPSVSCPKPARGRISYPPDFEDAWRVYPTDKLMSKKEAHDAWKRLDPQDREACAAALPAFVAYCRAHPDYRPIHMCRFIAKRRFDGFAPQTPDPEQIEHSHRTAAEREAYWLAKIAEDNPDGETGDEGRGVDLGGGSPDADADQLPGREEGRVQRGEMGGRGRDGAFQGPDPDDLRREGQDAPDRGQPPVDSLDALPPGGGAPVLRGRGSFQSLGGFAGQILSGASRVSAGDV